MCIRDSPKAEQRHGGTLGVGAVAVQSGLDQIAGGVPAVLLPETGLVAALDVYKRQALHFASRHMSWLHCMWGIGASLGPVIMGAALSAGQPWNLSLIHI